MITPHELAERLQRVDTLQDTPEYREELLALIRATNHIDCFEEASVIAKHRPALRAAQSEAAFRTHDYTEARRLENAMYREALGVRLAYLQRTEQQ